MVIENLQKWSVERIPVLNERSPHRPMQSVGIQNEEVNSKFSDESSCDIIELKHDNANYSNYPLLVDDVNRI